MLQHSLVINHHSPLSRRALELKQSIFMLSSLGGTLSGNFFYSFGHFPEVSATEEAFPPSLLLTNDAPTCKTVSQPVACYLPVLCNAYNLCREAWQEHRCRPGISTFMSSSDCSERATVGLGSLGGALRGGVLFPFLPRPFLLVSANRKASSAVMELVRSMSRLVHDLETQVCFLPLGRRPPAGRFARCPWCSWLG